MNISIGKLEHWVKDQVKHGDYDTQSEVVREAVRRMKDSHHIEPPLLQKAMDEAEKSGFKPFSRRDWDTLRRLATTGTRK